MTRMSLVHRSKIETRRYLSQLTLCVVAMIATACGSSGGGGSDGAAAVTGGASSNVVSGPGGSGSSGVSEAEQVQAFASTVHPILTANCSTCHAGSGPGSPHIAHLDATTAFNAVVDNQKVNFSTPASSRLVRRLVADLHYCWSDCVTDGATMQAAIEAWASLISFGSGGGTQVQGITSNSLTLADGVEDQSALRYEENVVALYTFKEGAGEMAMDSSGVAPAMDLTLNGEVEWMSNYGIDVIEGRAVATPASSKKLYDHIAEPNNGTQQYSVEAWVIPNNTDQTGPARIVTYSNGTQLRNFTLGQVNYNYVYRNTSLAPGVDVNGTPALETPDAEEDLQATLQHVVITFDQYRGRRIYVNGVFTDDEDAEGPGRLWNWDPNFTFVIGNETSNNRLFQGKLQLVAVYKYALTDAQIMQNFTAGIGKKLSLQFDISQYASAGSYLEFRVEEYDAYSYLFCDPRVVTSTPGLRLKNLQIAVNGQIPVSGQAFGTLDTTVTSSGATVSSTCSIVPKGVDPTSDIFTLDFEVLGDYSDPVVDNSPTGPTPIGDGSVELFPNEGVRDFARINDTMAAVTGVDPTTPAIQTAFDDLTQALPPTFDLRAFASAHQVSIAKLSLEYCNTLVETPALRDAFFPNFSFDQAPLAAFDANGRSIVVASLVNGMIGAGVVNQPTEAEVSPIINTLIDDLTAVCAVQPCNAERTRTVVKATCSAVLSSAAVTVH